MISILIKFLASFLHSSESCSSRNIRCWFATQETFLISIYVKSSCAASYFFGKSHFYRFFDK